MDIAHNTNAVHTMHVSQHHKGENM